MPLRRHLPAALALLAGAAAVVSLAPEAVAAPGRQPAAASYRLNPRHNITPPRAVYGRACREHPRGATCTTVLVKALDRARRVMGQPRYAVPARFAALEPQDQLLVLSDLDRRLYHRTPLTGRNVRLDASATAGARQNRDPSPVAKVNGARWYEVSSNWAGGTGAMGSPLFAYYEWMYDDGPGGSNLDCRHAGDSGCWGHRDDTLMTSPSSRWAWAGRDRTASSPGPSCTRPSPPAPRSRASRPSRASRTTRARRPAAGW